MPDKDKQKITAAAKELVGINDFPTLLSFLHDRMNWPIKPDPKAHDPVEKSTYTFKFDELGIDEKKVPAVEVREVYQLRPMHDADPFGIFLVSFDKKHLRMGAMRRILRAFEKRKRPSANTGDYQRWDMEDMIFISNYGESDSRKICFAYFKQEDTSPLPRLKVIEWDEFDTNARLYAQAEILVKELRYPNADEIQHVAEWQKRWREAFRHEKGHSISTVKELTTRLAELAITTRESIKEVMGIEKADGPLHEIMQSFKQAIFRELTVEEFADMYAQTMAYGLLQARLEADLDDLQIEDASKLVKDTNSFLNELFANFLAIGAEQKGVDFDEIKLHEVCEFLNEIKSDMHEVLKDFDRNRPGETPRIFLYEDFLKEYDRMGKIERGVFYTPSAVVRFIVKSVHEVLQKEFGLADGLADTTTWGEWAKDKTGVTIRDGWEDKSVVQILDPATGTGHFLLEAIKTIRTRLEKKWGDEGRHAEIDELWQEYTKTHLLSRLHGFEILMAPYAMTHLGIARELEDKMPKDKRANVYLTNSLRKPFDREGTLAFMSDTLTKEGEGADRIKSEVPVSMVIGNPPYSVRAQHDKEIKAIVEKYKFMDGKPLGERKYGGLQDDYVRFIKKAECMLHKTGMGILAFITNHGYLDGITFRAMRKHLMQTFDKIYIIDLHGKAGEALPKGVHSDKNIFNIKGVGVAIIIAIKHHDSQNGLAEVYYDGIWGNRKEKSATLAEKQLYDVKRKIDCVAPYFLFVPRGYSLQEEYNTGLMLTTCIPKNRSGIQTSRDGLVVALTEQELIDRLNCFSDPEKTESETRSKFPFRESEDWAIPDARKLMQTDTDWQDNICSFSYRPFDKRQVLYKKYMVHRLRHDVMRHMTAGKNIALTTDRFLPKNGGTSFAFVTDEIADIHLIGGCSYIFPLIHYPAGNVANEKPEANLSSDFTEALEEATGMCFLPVVKDLPPPPPKIGRKQPISRQYESYPLQLKGDLTTSFGCRDVFAYIYAILHSPEYRRRYAEFLRSDFPHIPLPENRDLFADLAKLGNELITLHLLDKTHPKLTQPSIRLCGQGDDRLFKTKSKIKWTNGKIHINPSQWFENIPEDLANFTIGSYKTPLIKWLEDRAGRTLTPKDILHYRRLATALHHTQPLMTKIDTTIQAHAGFLTAFTPSHPAN
ncbi:MAG: N-6 DNA methylase [Proteobacteria bacterium]|nr:N-6 DNA methylase [Pseudomonadota bacterium]